MESPGLEEGPSLVAFCRITLERPRSKDIHTFMCRATPNNLLQSSGAAKLSLRIPGMFSDRCAEWIPAASTVCISVQLAIHAV